MDKNLIGKIKELEQELAQLNQNLANPEVVSDLQKLKETMRKHSKITKIMEKYGILEKTEKEISDTSKILETETGEEMVKLANEDLIKLNSQKSKLEFELNELVNGKNDNLNKDAIMEIRAGAGGDEASIFAHNLFKMYTGYAKLKGWDIELLDSSVTNAGGYKEIIFEINGENVYGNLRFESGVHRVQRTPETEKMGRIHTSTASVAVLPKAEEVDVEIKPQDIKIEFFRSSGPGGQNVNKVETAVRIIHIPTGVIVSCQEGRSQQKNREKAMEVLRSKLYEEKMRKEEEKMRLERKEQIGTADRSEKIRTYNFPQDRITDHRIKKSWSNIESIMEGNIEEMIQNIKEELKM